MEKNPVQDEKYSLAQMRKFFIPFYLTATLVYLGFSLHYFTTGLGGTMLLAVTVVPIAYVMWVLNSFVTGKLPYPRLGFNLNVAIAAVYIAMCVFCLIYMRVEFDELIYDRAGFFNTTDKIVGIMMLGLVLEYTRREHDILFYLMIFLMFYSVYGSIFPGILGHPGVTWMRVITSSSVEISLGLFGTYSQVGVGVIAAFFMFLGVAQGFGVQESIVKTFTGIFAKRITLIPQTAVVTSMAIATCSGSGAANAAITGQYTIPLMKRAGFPALHAGAVEASASLGGLLMPPVMAIAGFLMADFLGVTYFEVIARGYAPAIIFFGIISMSVYLFTARFVKGKKSTKDVDAESIIQKYSKMDVVNTAIFFVFIGVLIFLMGVLWYDASTAALYIAAGLLVAGSIQRIIMHPGTMSEKLKEWFRCLLDAIEGFASVTAPLILLLAMLGVMINMFVVSGWMIKLMGLLATVGEYNVVALIAIGFAIGVFLGLGIPPSACYLLSAVIVIPPMTKFGINPWVAHFFLFFIAVISEYSPPTSLVAAVASRISGASFMKTMMVTLQISLPFFFLTFAIFNWDILLLEPGLAQLGALAVLTVGCMTAAVGIHGRLFERKSHDLLSRFLIILLALFILYYPRGIFSVVALIPALVMIIFVTIRTEKTSTAT
ncbi:MAG: TRAP transporter fused permease subunit [Deltaproteobacteria bacterium]|nr:TRAP transporter fused permease subunit [Deltaproteobacteria bacterium]